MRPTQEKQLNIVLNLNRLTKNGKIEWEPLAEDASTGHQRILYSTEWKGYRVQILHGNPPKRTQHAVHGSKKPKDYWIRIQNGEEAQIVIPPMSAISDLVDTIERKASLGTRETNDLETLDTFNELLEEEL